jgi:hypothetical protein
VRRAILIGVSWERWRCRSRLSSAWNGRIWAAGKSDGYGVRAGMSFAERMLKIDRRIIFAVIGLCTLLPLLYPVGLPIKISQEVRGVYDHIESLPERSVLLLSLDFDPASKLSCIRRRWRFFAMRSRRIFGSLQ